MESKSKQILVSLGSAVLRQSDIDNFQDGYWLNDSCITFYYEHLVKTLLPKDSKLPKIVLMDPSAASELIYSQFTGDPDQDELLNDIYGPLGLHKTELAFIPVNDNTDRTKAAGGSHWSLLVYHRSANKWYQIDSMTISVTEQSKAMSRNINYLVKPSETPIVESVSGCAKQDNSYDCGMYVLENTESILTEFIKQGGKSEFKIDGSILKGVTSSSVSAKRRQIMEIIGGYIEERRKAGQI
ncbi:hypothetical protein FGO68_gene1184 [Halteria grandinella]|uniref:Ubiquitin-like protease family profile domain-containing protein n=1 Tax=Halteria grandinella TaxID=5974 RepID=A0A8J8SZH3_HALGN|nr:hypothetical protein FGO68_gene1184 [Halteria grandinella]